MRLTLIVLSGLLALLPAATPAQTAADLPLLDGHMHYNEEARQVISPAQVIAQWQRLNIRYVLATSRPNTGSLDLMALARSQAAEIRFFPFLRPYQVQPDRRDWFKSPRIQAYVEAELKRGIYRGIGEFHIFGADADAPYVAQLTRLARERGLWLHAHCDVEALEHILAHAPGVKVIWAHTGMSTPLAQVETLLLRYPQILGELSYRGDLLQNGQLNPQWRALLIRHPTRFMLGTDTWINERWGEVPAIIANYRTVLAGLPRDVAENLAWRNGVHALSVATPVASP